ncbi:hypothetical protein OQ252_10675 [Acetobacter farinalis]|uniref:Uncharacterized protein n=1 Tax=Acetobacter farinalis TaxID=1260984 RepID=A0ABT3Q9B3_9PROT|nr:hypothetical protein [Acetobacter farinalis]MCX2561857.1 hypothetical protein [Acetobacter farinalis]
MMKAVCVTETRQLEVRDVPTPVDVPEGHILVDVVAAAINHGDRFFLSAPMNSAVLNERLYGIWGASASGVVRSIGHGVPTEVLGKNVALYRSLTQSPHSIGLWSERVVVPYTCALRLPDTVDAEEYSGSLVNAITGYAFLEEVLGEGHKGVIVTAGASATGRALAAIAQRRNIPFISLVRSEKAQEELRASGVEHVLVIGSEGFENDFAVLAEQLGTTAVFDGVGGDLINRIAPLLPASSSISFYGFLGGAVPVSVSSRLFIAKGLSMKGFSNFRSETVRDVSKLRAALDALSAMIDDPMFRTRLGQRFTFDEIGEAMAYEPASGVKAVLTPSHDPAVN